MTKLFFICCIVILLFQVAVGALRWMMKELKRHGLTTLYIIIGTVITCGVLALKFPAVKDRIYDCLKPLLVDLNFNPIVQLGEFLILTSLLRMLFEHFVLKLTYSKADWILFSILGVGWTYMTFRYFVF